MDGVFVPNFSYGMPIVAAIRQITKLPLDVHLMIADPGKYVKSFFEAGADIISFHVEAVSDPIPVLQQIQSLGAGSGIAINPQTPASRITGCLAHCDMVVVMSVEAGFGGQSFRAEVLSKFAEIRNAAGGRILLEIDGGVNAKTIGQCVDAGAESLVVGSAIFAQPDYGHAVNRLNGLIAEAKQLETFRQRMPLAKEPD
jgi:ribulose-phosphate 3-epimerase